MGISTQSLRRNYYICKVISRWWTSFEKLLKNAASSPYINGYETSKDRGLCAGEISEGTIQGFRGAGSYEKLQVKKEGRSCAVFPSIGAVACRIRVEPEPTADLQIG